MVKSLGREVPYCPSGFVQGDSSTLKDKSPAVLTEWIKTAQARQEIACTTMKVSFSVIT